MTELSHQYHHNFSGPADELVRAVRMGIEINGGSFNGNEYAGHFETLYKGPKKNVHLKGQYTIEENTLTVHVTKKIYITPKDLLQNKSFLKSVNQSF